MNNFKHFCILDWYIAHLTLFEWSGQQPAASGWRNNGNLKDDAIINRNTCVHYLSIDLYTISWSKHFSRHTLYSWFEFFECSLQYFGKEYCNGGVYLYLKNIIRVVSFWMELPRNPGIGFTKQQNKETKEISCQ